MCGIVSAVARRPVKDVLLDGLHHLEYRGYDSAGLAVVDAAGEVTCYRRPGKVSVLSQAMHNDHPQGHLGIAHTRWATHGRPDEKNTHPHSSRDEVFLVHNGIIENYQPLREELTQRGYQFESETDSEVIAHLIHSELDGDLLQAVQRSVARLEGAYAICVVSPRFPDRVVAARQGSPLAIGLGSGENFLASDPHALSRITDRFIHLEEGDVAEVSTDEVHIYETDGGRVERPVSQVNRSEIEMDKGGYRHFMLKEIFEQPGALRKTLEERVSRTRLLEGVFGSDAREIFAATRAVQILACGTSYHAGLVAAHWIESLVGIPCQAKIASEFRYSNSVVLPGSLAVCISQSGETADTLAALRMAREAGHLGVMAICNVADSTICREADLVMLTRAGVEIGVASTKAFTTQLATLMLLTLALGRATGAVSAEAEKDLVQALHELPGEVERALQLDDEIQHLAKHFVDKRNALFLGRGLHFPVAMEGALKLKEISYIHAEAYPAGELKHGPLALVDDSMPVVVVAPENATLEKLVSNMQEVSARGAQLYVFGGASAVSLTNASHRVEIHCDHQWLSPVVYTIPLQLLAYHVAELRGTDVDQPRNLAKSVTVE